MGSSTTLNPIFDDANISGPLFRLTIALIVLQTLIICLHLSARYLKRSTGGLETWFLLSGYVFNMAFAALVIVNIKLGAVGAHELSILFKHHDIIVPALKINLALTYIYSPAATLPKIAALCVYRRIMSTGHYPKIIYLIGGVLIANWIAAIFLASFTCRPYAFAWDKTIPHGYCKNPQLATQYIGLPHIVTDIAMLVVPLTVVWNLQMNRGQKVGLTITFLLGGIGTITAILRTYYFFTLHGLDDITWAVTRPLTWALIECATYQVAATGLTITPLVRSWRQKMGSWQFGSNRSAFSKASTIRGGSSYTRVEPVRLDSFPTSARKGPIVSLESVSDHELPRTITSAAGR